VSPKIEHINHPTNIWVIDNFFDPALAEELSDQFYTYEDERWLTRNNSEFEEKLLSTHWDWYPGAFYRTFFELVSNDFVNTLEDLTGIRKLVADYGLHAGGMHLHASNGRLNLHQDAKLHPKLGLVRKLNLIVYLNKNWEESWGGSLDFWDDKDGEPGEKIVSISPVFNRAVIFQTDGDFWHGLPEMIAAPNGENRESIAVFYYIENEDNLDMPTRARFALTEEQKANPDLVLKNEERMRTAFKYGR
jgi:Rps23 Pro-64 3,4-dihydroxylase Tpa1-like proline 4-hydroxylase